MDIQAKWEGMYSIDLDENRDNWLAVVNTVMNHGDGCNTDGRVWLVLPWISHLIFSPL
jgi:hypothetical protein